MLVVAPTVLVVAPEPQRHVWVVRREERGEVACGDQHVVVDKDEPLVLAPPCPIRMVDLGRVAMISLSS